MDNNKYFIYELKKFNIEKYFTKSILNEFLTNLKFRLIKFI